MKVWDLSTRLYHWAQAGLFMALLASGFSGNGPHVQLGLAMTTLIVWRMVWGFVGSETSRFRQFLRSPKRVLNYLLGRESSRPGHNPAGGWMVLTLLCALLVQCISGMALAGLLDNLPYAEVWLTDSVFSLLESAHLLLANLLPALVALHVGAIVFYKLRSKPLTWAMVTGKQTFLNQSGSVLLASQWRALLVLVVATSVTMAIVAFS
ncbi:cytochrome b/b6 domain-containing protein [Vibrio europaeus]|uniref:cytochrome b/b6 domain-containing protein n=1 Tax=Vibrio europaeus TaxID=300876 RepID=UPI0023423382|nr:cytochrome b/b6 domain-containing protein [Vibrio europaeus]MDC5849925.1 cytochrome b/b6 domain-containing protein [Vibrio europaeus]